MKFAALANRVLRRAVRGVDRHGWLIAGWWLLLAGGPVRATEVDLQLTTVGQGYQTRTLSGDLLDRRRITQWAGLRAVDLFGVAGLSLQVRLRFDTDLGTGLDQPASANEMIELLSAWIRIDDLFDRIDLSLGRQLLLDEIDFCQFDGLRVDARLPLGIGLRVFSGLAVRDRSWLAGGLLELEGPEQGEIPALLIGAGLGGGFYGLELGLDYRREVLWGPDWPLDAERLAAWASWSGLQHRLGLEAGATYDLAQDQFLRLRAEAWGRLPGPAALRLEAGFLQSRPHFALDSIFSFFSPAPFWQLMAGVRWDFAGPAERAGSLRLGYYHRGYQADEDPSIALGVPGSRVDGVDVDARWRFGPAGWLWLSAGFEDGAAGRRWLASPGVVWTLDEAIAFDGQLIVLSVDDPLDADFDALTVGGSAGLRWRFSPGRALLLTAELNSNRINPLRLRLLAVLDLAFATGPGGFR